MKNNKAFTLIELIVVLVILAIIATITTPIILNLLEKTENSARKRSIDGYGKALELAISSYVIDYGYYPDNLDNLDVNYKGNNVKCNEKKVNDDGSIYLSKCFVDKVMVKDTNTDDGYYHYGKINYTNIEYVNLYGKNLEEALKKYYNKHHKYPEDYNTLTLKKIDKEVSCDVKVNYDGSVYLTKCLVNNREVLDENNQDNYYQYGTKKYGIGELVSYNGMDFYVIENSDETSDRITMLKAEPLTFDEVNTYGVGHVNRYTEYSVGTAFPQFVYGGMAYYSSSTCGYNGTDWVYDGCSTNYDESEVKHVVDAWTNDKLKASDLLEDILGYKTRLLTFEDLINNLGYEKKNEGVMYPSTNGDTPSWLYNSNYSYWTMSQYGDSVSYVWGIRGSGNVGDSNVSSDYSGSVVRPVVTIKKSVL